jgi:hypothetical protein
MRQTAAKIADYALPLLPLALSMTVFSNDALYAFLSFIAVGAAYGGFGRDGRVMIFYSLACLAVSARALWLGEHSPLIGSFAVYCYWYLAGGSVALLAGVLRPPAPFSGRPRKKPGREGGRRRHAAPAPSPSRGAGAPRPRP